MSNILYRDHCDWFIRNEPKNALFNNNVDLAQINTIWKILKSGKKLNKINIQNVFNIWVNYTFLYKMLSQNRKNCLRYILEQKQSYVCQSDREKVHFLHLHENSLYIPAI